MARSGTLDSACLMQHSVSFMLRRIKRERCKTLQIKRMEQVLQAESADGMTATLAIHMGGVGDFILTLPALQHLAAEGPLELAGYRDRLSLAVAAGIARAAHSSEAIDLSSAFSGPSPRLCAFLQSFDRAVVWLRDEEGLLVKALRSAGLREVHCFPGLPPNEWPAHASEYYAQCVGLAAPPPPRLRLPEAGPPHGIVLHPGSGSARKNWPLEHYEALTGMLLAENHAVSWCLGPAEEETRVPRGVEAIRCESLVTLAHRLQRVALFIGNDSGITHLASALGRPVVALFGPTDPKRWGPRGEKARILCGVPWPNPEAVFREIGRALQAFH